jgi:hypothetical protein
VIQSSGKLEIGIEAGRDVKIEFKHGKGGFRPPGNPEDDRRQRAGF